jgi:hypothetical protein
MRFTVGGENHDITPEDVVRAVKRLEAEPIREHLVEVADGAYPPKQVFAAVTGRERQSFTTMEAERILRRLGFVCRRASSAACEATADPVRSGNLPDELKSMLLTMQSAIAGLELRVRTLESA